MIYFLQLYILATITEEEEEEKNQGEFMFQNNAFV